ncbi:MAG: PEP-CTERM sorting domain-containing protein [Verrucomicrobia bacterium]|nr:PEP-CTERM sorting domain-containing protein [Verrucomicrobiota bacterium]
MTTFKNTLKSSAVAIVASGALLAVSGAGSVANASIQDLLFATTLWEDISFESQNVDLNSNGLLDVGDTLRGILEISNVVDQGPGGTVSASPSTQGGVELTAIFETVVTSKVSVGAPGSGNFNFTFGPHTPFAAEFGGLGTGAMVAFFTDSVLDNDFGTGLAGCTVGAGNSCEAFASGDTLQLVLGHDGSDGDERWEALGAPEDSTIARDFSTTTSLGTFNVNLSIVQNNTGFVVGQVVDDFPFTPLDDRLIDVAASGGIKGSCLITSFPGACPSPTSSYDVTDDVKFRLSLTPPVRVSEPATFAMFGLGLLGLGAARRRRNKKA